MSTGRIFPSIPADRVPFWASMTAAYGLGVFLDIHLDVMVLPTTAAMWVCAVVAWMAPWRFTVLAAAGVTMAALGSLHHHQSMRMLPAGHVYTRMDGAMILARVQGRVETRPTFSEPAAGPFRRWTYHTARTSFDLAATSIDVHNNQQAVTGRLAVHVNGHLLNLQAGDPVEVLGELAIPLPPANPGGFDWRAYQRRQGVWVNLYVSDPANVIRAGYREASWLRTMQDRAAAILSPMSDGRWSQEQGLLETMILGRRSAIDQELQQAFARTGCAHLLAVSGSNVAVLVLFTWRLCQFMGISGRRAMMVGMIVILFYFLLVDPFPPVRRAVIMGLISGLSVCVGRPAWALHALSLSALVLLLINPALLIDASFLLSYACMVGLMAVYPALLAGGRRLRRRWDPMFELRRQIVADQGLSRLRRVGQGAGRLAVSAVAVSVATTLAAYPILAYYFGRVPVWGGVNTALVLPLFSLIVILSFLAIAVGVLLPTLGVWISSLVTYLTTALIWVVDRLDAVLGGNVYVGPPSAAMCLAYYTCLALGVCWARGWIRWRWSYLLAPASLVGFTAWAWVPEPVGHLRITALSVGRGLATVVESPGGGTIIYDAGSGIGTDVGGQTMVPCLFDRGHRQVQAAYISHANLDHYSGLPGLLDAGVVRRCFISHGVGGPDIESGPWKAMMSILDDHKIKPVRLHRDSPMLTYEDTQVDVLWPPADPPWPVSGNDASLVVRVSRGGRSILLCGDIEERVQEWLLEHEDVRADVLVSPHHGSLRTSTPEFADRVGAVVEIVSNARGQGMPPDGRRFHTGYDGAVTVELAAESVKVSGFRSGRNARLAYHQPAMSPQVNGNRIDRAPPS